MPDVPGPHKLPDEAEMLKKFGSAMPLQMRQWYRPEQPIEMRLVDIARYGEAGAPAPQQRVWLRARGRLPDDPGVHRAILAYFSDMTMLDTALATHRSSIFAADIQAASLDHALWFHRPFRADEWLLFVQESPNMSGARGLTRGLVYTHDGRLVASIAQEGVIRLRGPRG
jgi:acyl-CoA thioesterase-2